MPEYPKAAELRDRTRTRGAAAIPTAPARSGSNRFTWACLSIAILLAAAGCQSMSNSRAGIDDVIGPIERALRRDKAAQQLADGGFAGSEELQELIDIHDRGEFARAAPGFKSLARKYKDQPVEEDALYYYAECLYQMKDYPSAQDAYEQLFKKYQSTRYMEPVTQHLFEIAKYWLNAPKSASDVEMAAYTQGGEAGLRNARIPPPVKFTFVPNFFDKTRPTWDTGGQAVRACKSIWTNDPTGPLADDAIMLAATHSLRIGDYREADLNLDMLRTNYPLSEHTEAAYVLGPYVKLRSYQGPEYDPQQLEQARNLAQSALRLYPNLKQRPMLARQLGEINHQMAERDWRLAQYWMRRGQLKSAAVSCELILQDFPGTQYADKAMELMAKVGPENAAGVLQFADADNPYLRGRRGSGDAGPGRGPSTPTLFARKKAAGENRGKVQMASGEESESSPVRRADGSESMPRESIQRESMPRTGRARLGGGSRASEIADEEDEEFERAARDDPDDFDFDSSPARFAEEPDEIPPPRSRPRIGRARVGGAGVGGDAPFRPSPWRGE
jgi:outer membrane protein assembly factor BamD (BamD/ComL family)